MCQESSLYHFGQGKTQKIQTNQCFLRDPEKIRVFKKNPHMGVSPSLISPGWGCYVTMVSPLFCVGGVQGWGQG